ncbi:MAG: SPOR domain-containing protein [Hyphomicrobiaceae bacterium]
MARSEDFGQGRGRARRPYDDQDRTDRRASAPLSIERSDTPTQTRRAGTSYAPQFDRYVTQPAAEPVQRAAYPTQAAPRTGRTDLRQTPPAHGGYEAQPPAWEPQDYRQAQAEPAWPQEGRTQFGTRQRAAQTHQGYGAHEAPPAAGYGQQQGWDNGYDHGQGYDYDPMDHTSAQQGYGGYPQGHAGAYQGYDPNAPHGGYDQPAYAAADAGHYPDQAPQGYPQHYPQQGYDEYAQDYPQGYAEPGYAGEDMAYAQDDYVETDPSALPPAPSRSRRGLIVAGAFVAAVLIGGGLGFVYKMTNEASFAASGEPPLLTAGDDPVKTVPEGTADADDGSTKTIFDRLNNDGETTSDTALADGAEVVDVARSDEPTVIETQPMGISLGGDGSSDEPVGAIAETVAEGEVAPKIRKVEVVKVVPGELIDTSVGEAADTGLDNGDVVSTTAPAPEEAQPDLDGQALVTKPKTKKAKSAEEQVLALANAGAEAPATNTAKSTGYLVQVSVANTRLDALSAFADMQQRYGSLLGGSEPDIQAIGSNKGYRLRIGPPASKQAASTLCNKLKAAGHKDCFIRSN